MNERFGFLLQLNRKSPDGAKKKEKNKRQWDLNGSNRDLPELDHSKDKDAPQINGAAFLDPDEVIQLCTEIFDLI